jgi:predicted ArsR family transcriptional regulator
VKSSNRYAKAYKASRNGAKSTHAKPTIDEVMKIVNELKQMGLHDAAETLMKSWLRETNGGRNMHSRTGEKSTHAADSLRALAVKLGYAPDAVTVEDGRGTITFARNDGSAGRLAFALRKPLAGVIASDRISVADDAVCIDMRGEA